MAATSDTPQTEPTDKPAAPADTLVLRHPTRHDGAAMWRLVRDHGGLELNSGYSYVVLGEDFSATSIVAYDAGSIRGFVLGYRPPTRPEVLFVWQVGVDPRARGRGLARRMLLQLLDESRPHGVRFLEATVTASNEASLALFRSIARDLDVACDVHAHLPAEAFPEPGHEAEQLFRIGPL